ncbi:hypothetical protein M413DRAFT_156045 [Hebeloma cylindrosporum]|uniref:Uncharacterized protein n=1 Tax=Hebeloma cylindrosporum TaxID=76867 RepID=A0A0C3CBC3_HEBCY|nr:hypothetical protein M413DRAFT_156045 [Hebeloma cylindrosporum h7]
MPSPIPQEIIDSCIDNLAFDVSDSDQSCEARKALFLCSLASRALGQRARYHIFSDIRIRPSPGDVRSQQLRDIMKEDPNICRFIRTLDIHIADKGPQTTATSRTGLPDILNMLSRRSGEGESRALRFTATQIEILGAESIKNFFRLWLISSTTPIRTRDPAQVISEP